MQNAPTQGFQKEYMYIQKSTFQREQNTGNGVEWLDGEQHTTEKCPMQGFSEREEHRDGESKGMERVQGWKEIDGLHEHMRTKNCI